MRVLNLASNDYANVCHENANALRSVGVSCLDWTTNLHPFGYTTQSEKVSYAEIQRRYKQFDVIQLFHSDATIYRIIKDHPNVVIYHTGTRYRQDKSKFDELFKGRTIITDQCEFLLHNPTFNYLAPHTTLKPVEKHGSKLIIGHYPSNADTKGTKDIERMLTPFINDFDIRIDETKVSHEENLQRVSECHIYIELFKPLQDGKPYGCFGVSAFEATALGSLVITNNINRSAYENVYGHHPFLTPNTMEAFVNTIVGLHNTETYTLTKEAFHNRFYEKHGITNTGLRIKQLIQ
jgi:hypothetical protein